MNFKCISDNRIDMRLYRAKRRAPRFRPSISLRRLRSGRLDLQLVLLRDACVTKLLTSISGSTYS